MQIIIVDMESFWNSKDYTLSKMGPLQYIRDPRFHVQLLGYKNLMGGVQVVEGDTAIKRTLRALNLESPDTITVAHNGNGFDFLILSEHYGIRPYCMVDTICMMRWCGLARLMSCSHAQLTKALGHGVKTAGTVISDGKQWPQDFTPEEQVAFKRYCADDVEQCALNFSWLFQYCTPKAMQFMSLTAKMATNPMLLLDTTLIDEYLRDLDAATEKARESIGKLFHFDTQEDFLKAIRSKSSFVQMLRTFGVEPPMKYSTAKSLTMKAKMEAEGQDTSDPDSYAIYEPALAKTDLEFTAMQEHPDPRVALLVNTRLEQNSSAARSRAVRLRDLAGPPLPVMLSAFLAHTSRYTAGQSESASDSINLQNMGKRQAHLKKLRRAIKVPQGYKLVAVDSGQIEARVLAYEAQETELLHHFATGGDPYAEQAEKFGYGPSAQEIHDGAKSGDAWLKTLRNVGKTCVLSCWEEGTLVLTDRGWVPIVDITLTDKVFDGEAFCPHGGVIYNGVSPCESIGGSKVTSEHLIAIDEAHWQPAGFLDNEAAFAYGEQVLRAAGIEVPVASSEEHRDDTLMVPFTRRVFDIRNVGDKHQYIVQTRTGHVLVSHNCGYGVSAKKFSDTLLRQDIKLNEDLDKHYELAMSAHQIYRASNPHITAFWRACDGVLKALLLGGSGAFGGPDGSLFRYGTDQILGRNVPSVWLPTGFALRYPNLRTEMNEQGRMEYRYDQFRGRGAVPTRIYGASLTENLTQALAFQILMEQACAIDAAGIPIAVNVHDCWAAVVPEHDAERVAAVMSSIMASAPAWAQGLPLSAEAEIGDDYTVA